MPNTAQTTLSSGSMPAAKKIRLSYLDGLRGLAAFYVFLNHLYSEIVWRAGETELPRLVQSLIRCFAHGRFAVAVFIVLSGYCLMLPVVTQPAGDRLPGGLLNYFKRRAKRILPPYYAALLISLLLFALVPPALDSGMGHSWNNAQPAFRPDILLSHGLLLHNLNLDWVYKINGPMWSVATEWQIYFLFPFLLLPVWRRCGIFLTPIVAFTVGLIPHYFVPDLVEDAYKFLDWAVPWHLGLFSLGMAGAAIGFSPQPNLIWLRERLPWYILSLGLIALLIVERKQWQDDRAWIVDALVGAIVTCLLIYCTRCLTQAQNSQQPLILRLLNLPGVVMLGSFSYSLYLFHAPILGIAQLVTNTLPVSPAIQLTILPLLAVPLVLLGSYGFHLVVERRFMHHYPKKQQAIL